MSSCAPLFLFGTSSSRFLDGAERLCHEVKGRGSLTRCPRDRGTYPQSQLTAILLRTLLGKNWLKVAARITLLFEISEDEPLVEQTNRKPPRNSSHQKTRRAYARALIINPCFIATKRPCPRKPSEAGQAHTPNLRSLPEADRGLLLRAGLAKTVVGGKKVASSCRTATASSRSYCGRASGATRRRYEVCF